MLNPFHSRSFAVDLGNNNTLMADSERLLLAQPSYIVYNRQDKSVRAVGDEAYAIFEKSHDMLKPVRPLRWGVIADYASTTHMLDRMVRQVYRTTRLLSRFDRIVSGVPFDTTSVERMALRNVMEQFHSRQVNLVFEPLAAAVGMGLNIREPEGRLVIDIGGGITEIVIISLSGVSVFESLKVAGDSLTEAVIDHVRHEHHVILGWKTAEQVKTKIGGALRSPDGLAELVVKGKDLADGIPVPVTLRHDEIVKALDATIRAIEDKLIQTLDAAPPELAADIFANGIHLTGGSALLRGMPDRLSRTTGLTVHRDPTPLLSVSKGLSKVLMKPKEYRAVLN